MLYFCSLPKEKQIGLSPSGKATDFDSVTRGFESRQPSHVAASPCGSPRLSFAKVTASPFGLPLLSAKSHARLGCSVASALADASLSLPAFCGITFTQHPCPSSPKKVTLASPVRLQARARRLCARYQPFSVRSAPLALIDGADFPFYGLLLYLLRKSRLRLSGCRSSPQKATLGSAARLQAPSLTPHCRYQLFAG